MLEARVRVAHAGHVEALVELRHELLEVDVRRVRGDVPRRRVLVDVRDLLLLLLPCVGERLRDVAERDLRGPLQKIGRDLAHAPLAAQRRREARVDELNVVALRHALPRPAHGDEVDDARLVCDPGVLVRLEVGAGLLEELARVLAVLVLVGAPDVREAALAVRAPVELECVEVLDVVAPAVDVLEGEFASVAAGIGLEALAVPDAGSDGGPVLGPLDADEVLAVGEPTAPALRAHVGANRDLAGLDACRADLDLGLELAAALEYGVDRRAGGRVVEGERVGDRPGLVDGADLPSRRLERDLQGGEEAVPVRPLVVDAVAARLGDGVDRGVRPRRRPDRGPPGDRVLADVLVVPAREVLPHETVPARELVGRGDVDVVVAVELVGVDERQERGGADRVYEPALAVVDVDPHHTHLSRHSSAAVPPET